MHTHTATVYGPHHGHRLAHAQAARHLARLAEVGQLGRHRRVLVQQHVVALDVAVQDGARRERVQVPQRRGHAACDRELVVPPRERELGLRAVVRERGLERAAADVLEHEAQVGGFPPGTS